MEELWSVDPEKKPEAHWIDFVSTDGFSSAAVLWDGCIHYNEYNYTRDDMKDLPKKERDEGTTYFHICDLDEIIASFTALRDIAKAEFAKFNKEWPG